MKTCLFVLLLIHFQIGFAQNQFSEDCWKCQVASMYQLNSVKNTCQAYIDTSSNELGVNRARFILAQQAMRNKEYKSARNLLKQCSFTDLFLPSIQLGLIGDTYSEEGNIESALEQYKRAAFNRPNELTTPHYLFKSYLCAVHLRKYEEADKCLITLTSIFPDYKPILASLPYQSKSIVSPFNLTINERLQPKNLGYGTISGQPVNIDEYQHFTQLVLLKEEQNQSRYGDYYEASDESEIWEMYVYQHLISREIELLGISVSEQELDAYIMGNNGFPVLHELKLAFTNNETGDFDPELLRERLNSFKNSDYPLHREAFEETISHYRMQRKNEIYFKYIDCINFTTALEIDFEKSAAKHFEIEFEYIPYSDVETEKIEINNEALLALYQSKEWQENKKSQATINIEIVKIPFYPSKSDTLRLLNELNTLKHELAAGNNDSVLVMTHSEIPFYSSGPYSVALPESHSIAQQHQNFPSALLPNFIKAQKDEIIGPYKDDTLLVLAKVIGHIEDSIRARHILLMCRSEQERAQNRTRAKKILSEINDSNFSEFVNEFSDDYGTEDFGGDLGYFFFSQMVQPFAVYCAEQPIGQIGIVETQFGIHIVQVTERKGTKYPKLAKIVKTLKTSQTTKDSILAQIETFLPAINSDFEHQHGQFSSFANRFNTSPTQISINTANPVLHGFEVEATEEAILRFAFDSVRKIGDYYFVNSTIEPTLIRFVGHPTDSKQSFESAYQQLMVDYIKQQKSAIITNRLLPIQENTLNNRMVRTIAFDQTPQSHPLSTNDVNAILRLNDQQVYPSIINADNGVVVVFRKEIVPTPEQSGQKMHLTNKHESQTHFQSADIFRALRSDAAVIYNRRLYRLGIRP